ncbi:hypothetical protein AwWohl_08590 [Gammaproteobacteria bacterium]|nr:hypothetical protein AwWohl_08590 [Gammaproteobacteria bacterium]
MINPSYRFLGIPTIGFLILILLYWILARNLEAGVYPIESDHIGLPLFSGSLILLLIAIFEFCAAMIAYKRMKKYSFWHIFYLIIMLALHAMALTLLILSVLAWAKPHHFLLSYAYGIAALLVVYCSICDFRLLLFKS